MDPVFKNSPEVEQLSSSSDNDVDSADSDGSGGSDGSDYSGGGGGGGRGRGGGGSKGSSKGGSNGKPSTPSSADGSGKDRAKAKGKGKDKDTVRKQQPSAGSIKTPSHQFRGVTRAQQGADKGRWTAAVTVNKKRLVVGRYDTPEEAAAAYDTAAVQHLGAKVKLNFPDGPPPGAGGAGDGKESLGTTVTLFCRRDFLRFLHWRNAHDNMILAKKQQEQNKKGRKSFNSFVSDHVPEEFANGFVNYR